MGERPKTILHYTNPEQLKDLIAIFADSSIDLDVTIDAVVPKAFHELRTAAMEARQQNPESTTRLKRKLLKDNLKGKLLEGQEKPTRFAEPLDAKELEAKLLEESKKLKVMPFTELIYNFDVHNGPKVEHRLFGMPPQFAHPANFLGQQWRYFTARLKWARGEGQISLVKETVQSLDPKEYEITFLKAGLNPKDWHSEYLNGVHYEATLHAYDGIIRIDGIKIDTDIVVRGKKVDLVGKLGFNREPRKQLALPAPK